MSAGSVNGNYGRKRVRYPDGTIKLEYVTRVVYMCDRQLLIVPTIDAHGTLLEISHLCGHSICINKEHLILEGHSINMEGRHCALQGLCS